MLGGVVARGDDGKAAFRCFDRDMVPHLAGEENVGAFGERALPFVVRRAAANGYLLDLSHRVSPSPRACGEFLIDALLEVL